MTTLLPQSFFAKDAIQLAKELLGKKIIFGCCEGIIVETEAYKRDPASHAYKITPRSQIMQDTHGHIYVYKIYGMYHCLNVTSNQGDVGAVLIRAIKPTMGLDLMQERRLKKRKKQTTLKAKELCSGPSKLCDAFAITKEQNNKVVGEEIQILDAQEISESQIHATSRIGITQGKDLLWRFYIKENEYVSIK